MEGRGNARALVTDAMGGGELITCVWVSQETLPPLPSEGTAVTHHSFVASEFISRSFVGTQY